MATNFLKLLNRTVKKLFALNVEVKKQKEFIRVNSMETMEEAAEEGAVPAQAADIKTD